MIATTENSSDDPIIEFADKEGIQFFRGSESDVLGRYVGAAMAASADIVIRSTADCPLIDPTVVDRVIDELIDNKTRCDYVSNTEIRTYPRGLDVEAFYFDALLRMDRYSTSSVAREHVTIAARSEFPERFLRRDVSDTVDNSDLRLTVDTEVDLKLIKRIFADLDLGEKFSSYIEIISYIRSNPELISLNKDIETWNPE